MACIKDIEDFAGVKLGPGTLYGCLAKLEEAGLVEALPSEARRHPDIRITRGSVPSRSDCQVGWIAKIGLKRIAGAV